MRSWEGNPAGIGRNLTREEIAERDQRIALAKQRYYENEDRKRAMRREAATVGEKERLDEKAREEAKARYEKELKAAALRQEKELEEKMTQEDFERGLAFQEGESSDDDASSDEDDDKETLDWFGKEQAQQIQSAIEDPDDFPEFEQAMRRDEPPKFNNPLGAPKDPAYRMKHVTLPHAYLYLKEEEEKKRKEQEMEEARKVESQLDAAERARIALEMRESEVARMTRNAERRKQAEMEKAVKLEAARLAAERRREQRTEERSMRKVEDRKRRRIAEQRKKLVERERTEERQREADRILIKSKADREERAKVLARTMPAWKELLRVETLPAPVNLAIRKREKEALVETIRKNTKRLGGKVREFLKAEGLTEIPKLEFLDLRQRELVEKYRVSKRALKVQEAELEVIKNQILEYGKPPEERMLDKLKDEIRQLEVEISISPMETRYRVEARLNERRSAERVLESQLRHAKWLRMKKTENDLQTTLEAAREKLATLEKKTDPMEIDKIVMENSKKIISGSESGLKDIQASIAAWETEEERIKAIDELARESAEKEAAASAKEAERESEVWEERFRTGMTSEEVLEQTASQIKQMRALEELEKSARDRATKAKLEKERVERESLENLEKERLEKERLAKELAEKLEMERVEKERLERESAEKARRRAELDASTREAAERKKRIEVLRAETRARQESAERAKQSK